MTIAVALDRARAWMVACTVGLALGAPVSSRAQEPAEEDWSDDLVTDDVVVTTITEAEEVARSTDSVRVIETEEARTQSADMGDVIARTEGVSVRRSGGLGSSAQLCIHGICDRGIRYYLDGVPLELAGFGLGIASVPVHLIERIEIHRGAVPIRLAADALGGVIDLVRNQAYFAPHLSGSVQLGSFGTYRLFYEAGYRHQETGLFAGVSAFYDRSDNDYWIDVPDAGEGSEPVRARRFHDGYSAYGLALEAGVTGVAYADRLLLRTFVSEYDRDLQHNVVMALPYGEAVHGEVSWGAVLRYQHAISTDVSIDAYVGYTRRDISFRDTSEWRYDWYGRRIYRFRVSPGEIARARDQATWEDAIPARLNLTWQITDEHAVALSVTPELSTRSGVDRLGGADGRDPLRARQDLVTLVSALEHRLSLFDGVLENAVFVKDYVHAVSSVEPLPGGAEVRHQRDGHDVGIGDGVRAMIVDGLLVRATYELATRLPDPFEIFGDGVLVAPNVELAPERSHNGTLEVALDLAETPIGAVQASAAGFVRSRENMIVLLGTDSSLAYENVDGVLALGVEASARWESPGDWLALHANGTYLEDRNTSTEGAYARMRGDRMPNRPWLLANFGATFRARDLLGRDELALSWRARYVHAFFRGWESQGAVDTKQLIPSQLGQDLSLTYTVFGTPRVSTTIEVTNLGDQPLFDLFGVQRPGRAVSLKLSIDY